MEQHTIASSLDFNHGITLASKVRSIFSTPIHPPSLDGFHLVVSFGRASFRLDLPNVQLALQSCLGAEGASLHITHLRDRVFKFTVISKAIGFFIYRL
jgi:hypothetical protein